MILRELADRLGCALRGDGAVEVDRVAPIDAAGPGSLTFVASAKWAVRLRTTQASAVIVHPSIATPLPSLLSDNPYLAFAGAVVLLHPKAAAPPGVHPSAVVHPTAALGEGVHIAALAVVGARTRIGARSVVHPHVVLHEDVQVGEDCVLHSGVQVREACRLGDRVVVQNGAVIGADGFGFAKDAEGRYHKIPQMGTVVIEDDVEVGALTAIDRAALGETRIGRGTKLDNLVQIGHSVTVGRDTVLAGQVGVAGSSTIGDRVTLARLPRHPEPRVAEGQRGLPPAARAAASPARPREAPGRRSARRGMTSRPRTRSGNSTKGNRRGRVGDVWASAPSASACHPAPRSSPAGGGPAGPSA